MLVSVPSTRQTCTQPAPTGTGFFSSPKIVTHTCTWLVPDPVSHAGYLYPCYALLVWHLIHLAPCRSRMRKRKNAGLSACDFCCDTLVLALRQLHNTKVRPKPLSKVQQQTGQYPFTNSLGVIGKPVNGGSISSLYMANVALSPFAVNNRKSTATSAITTAGRRSQHRTWNLPTFNLMVSFSSFHPSSCVTNCSD